MEDSNTRTGTSQTMAMAAHTISMTQDQNQDLDPDHQSQTSAPPRRSESRYRNAPPGVSSRRRAQNRASQRAYRERKEHRIRHLESLLQEAALREQTLTSACLALQAEYERLRDGYDDASSHRVPVPPVPGISDNTALLPTQLDPALMQNQAVETGELNLAPDLYDHNSPPAAAAHRLSWCSRT
ncbi:hypothetical protein C2857_002747 [Epichloe festucae Fl1]|uniref:Putative transcription factor kapC n=1 Tax=Epichloe festucae (strain Fl1) TaxID=877507 RepID=A0A7S9KUJ5_EPIFF|nr:hypothetical protein C2857_002747 [Epichloe festucae Fl1]